MTSSSSRWAARISSGNSTNSCLRGTSPEGACRVETRGAVIPHPKVLPGSAGGRRQGIRPSWRARAAALVRLAVPSLPSVLTCRGTAGPRPRWRLGLIRVPASGLAGIQPAHGDQAEPEIADFGQHPMRRGLVREQAADHRLLAPAADLQAVEPGGPPAVQDTLYADLIPGGVARGGQWAPASARPGRQSVPCPAVRIAPAAKTIRELRPGPRSPTS